MKKKKIDKICIGMLMATLIIFGPQSIITTVANAGGGCGGGGGHHGGGGGGGGGQLSEYEIQSLLTAIEAEYYAKAVYQKVLDTFGSIQPFWRIRNQEQCHANMVANVLVTYGIQVPPDEWAGQITIAFPTKQYACEVGVQAEIENAALYDSLLIGVTNSDVIWTFDHLRDASRFNHEPTFQSWADYYESIGE